MAEGSPSRVRKIGVFHLTMITVSFVASIRTTTMMAKYGFSSLFYYLVGSICFLIPVALISAELSTAWPSRGGIYTWVKEAIPGPFGFLSIWIQFLSAMFNMPIFLSFLAATSTYIFCPSLANNKYYILAFILAVLWSMTFLSFLDIKSVGWVNTIAMIFGLFIPLGLIFILAIIWMILGRHINTPITVRAFFPDLSNFKNLAFLVGLVYSLSGLETSGSHALDTTNEKVYSRAMFLSSFIVTIIGFGALAIAMVIPAEKIGLLSGLMDAFREFLFAFNLTFLVPVIAGSIVFGYIISTTSTIIGPARGLFGSSMGGEIPPILCKQNKHGMPANMFVFQAILATLISCVILLMPSAESGYMVLIDSISMVYMLMYILMIIAFIVLRYKKPEVKRPYKIAGGKLGMWLIACLGLLSAIAGIVFSFIPSPDVSIKYILRYESLSVICAAVMVGLGLVIYLFRKPAWINSDIK